ncbi:MAG: hypothetical protein IT371_31130 [Deltaproteobacteria bacterium]|nr:hypothetical protein [Deltaproteobacteria bacterium]
MEANPTWYLGSAGAARVMERVHAGDRFDVYRLEGPRGRFALKVPSPSPAPQPLMGAERIVGGVSTYWCILCSGGKPAGARGEGLEAGASLVQLLEDEAFRLHVAGQSWNHSAVALVSGPLDDGEEVIGLVTDWRAGLRLDYLPQPEVRTLLPKMLPFLWDALSVAVHGDLQGSNIILGANRSRYSLIDPGAMVLAERGQREASEGASSLTFVTNAARYPILPPYYFPERPLASSPTLQEHWASFVRGLTLDEHAPLGRLRLDATGQRIPGFFGHFLTQEREAPKSGTLQLLVHRPGEPHPADLLAVGILYYLALTGDHPFPEHRASPAWMGLSFQDNQVTAGVPELPCLARKVVPPSAINPTVRPGEDVLALALLNLQVPTGERLSELVHGAAMVRS